MNEKRESEILTQWLKILGYVMMASIANSLLSLISLVPAQLTTWISWGIAAASIVCMFRLGPVDPRYRKAGSFRAAMLVLTLAAAMASGYSILVMAASVMSLLGLYQEYSGHSEVIAGYDTKLSGKWHSLFNWSLGAGVLVGLGSVISVLVMAVLEMDPVRITAIVLALVSIPQLVIDLVYLSYLKRMRALIAREPGSTWDPQ